MDREPDESLRLAGIRPVGHGARPLGPDDRRRLPERPERARRSVQQSSGQLLDADQPQQHRSPPQPRSGTSDQQQRAGLRGRLLHPDPQHHVGIYRAGSAGRPVPRPLPAVLCDGARSVSVHRLSGPGPRVRHQRRNAQLLDADDGHDRGPLTTGGTMNKRTVGLLSVVLVTCLPGCVDLNEEVVTGLTPGAYGSEGVFQALVNASYEPLRSFWAQEQGFTLTEFGTDIYTKGADGSYKFVNDYTTQLNPTVDYITNTWNNFYRAINTINAALDQAPVVKMDSSAKVERMAEVRFLRALYYFYLVQMFGPLHITLHEITAPTTEAHRYPVDSVYDGVIIPDLQYAEAHLPSVQQDYGRATKGAVQHLLAKVYLTRLRVPDNAAADEAAKQQAGDFANAADYAQRVINSGFYQLLPRFADVFDFNNEKNAEVVWSVQFTNDTLTTGNCNQGHLFFLMEYDVLPGMMWDIANGRPFKRFRPNTFFLGLYDRTKDSRYQSQFTRVWYANNAATIPKYPSGAPKFQLGDTAVYVSAADSDTLLVKPPDTVLVKPKLYRVYTPRTYSNRIFPSLNKFHDPFRLTVNDVRGSRDFFVARLAETYLIAAEALLRDGRATEALPYINAVRRRAAIPGHEAEMELTAAQLTLDEVLNERARELAGEMQRWFDLVRTHTLLSRVKAYNPDGGPNIQPYHVLRPIPRTQMDGTTCCYTQNPGY